MAKSQPSKSHEQSTKPVPADLRAHPLAVVGAGMCCALGYHLAAACCALRAEMDHFQESAFVDSANAPLVVAQLPFDQLGGAERLAFIVHQAVMDCARDAGNIYPKSTALILLAAEEGRPHTEHHRYYEAFNACKKLFPVEFHESSGIMPKGRAGIASALQAAHRLLTEETVKQVLLVGADSYVNAATIGHYLKQDRLQCTGNSDGFIPGEGAGALLLELATGQSKGTHITGMGRAIEEATIGGDIPNRALGLTQAMRDACDQAGVALPELKFRMTDQNGEKYYANEMANACTRLMADSGIDLPMLTIANCIGETGAAAGPLMIAYLRERMRGNDTLGDVGLLHMGNDDGTRTALVLRAATA
jgi:3-oxoacyl-[acyl-carrier-protein] synthase I